jgi:hypothetical protein
VVLKEVENLVYEGAATNDAGSICNKIWKNSRQMNGSLAASPKTAYVHAM